MIRSFFAGVTLSLVAASSCQAWGPQAHAFLGRAGAGGAGLGGKQQQLAASAAVLADLDHTLKRPGVVGDTVAFARALMAVKGRSADSDTWALGWLAHAQAQDPGQGEISDKKLKFYADFILDRERGQQICGAVYDPERIRRAAIALGDKPPSTQEIVKAVEQLVLVGVVEGALIELVPLELDARAESAGDRLRNLVPDFDLIPPQWREPGRGLPSARSLMPRELASYERRLRESLETTKKLFENPPAAGATVPAAGSLASRAHPLGTIPLPPARAMGLAVRTRASNGGLVRTTVTLSSLLLFKPAALVMLEKVGSEMFPTVVRRWDAASRLGDRAPALRNYLRESANRMEQAFPDAPKPAGR